MASYGELSAGRLAFVRTTVSSRGKIQAMPHSVRARPVRPTTALPGRIEVRRFAGPAGFVGKLSHLRVAHLTDLHVGRVTPMAVQDAAVLLTNLEQPDLVAVSGDFVAHSLRFLDELAAIINAFAAPVVCVLGNHDHWAGATAVRETLRRAGALVLDNQHTTITLRGQRLQIVGLDDAFTGHAHRARAVRGLRPGIPTIGLSHIGEEADGLWRHGVSLVLSGHTHAGQITAFGFNHFSVARLAGHRYVHGLYGTREGGAPEGAVYVGAGIGAAVIPWRLGERARREIAIFELGHVPGSFDEHHAEQAPFPGRIPSEKQRARRAARAARGGARKR
jgi:uncharacterized protein